MSRPNLLTTILLSLPLTVTLAQKPTTIKLDNPSFEDYPQAGHVPMGWFNCGFANETPPDVHPNNLFNVSKPAQNGTTYLGLVVRDNNTWESIGQRLKSPLLKGVSYNFSFHVVRSETYMSPSKTTSRDVNYDTPVMLRIWGGNGFCTKEELLHEVQPVKNVTWQKMTAKIKAEKSNYTHITFEAFYKVPTLFPYNGNLLLDNFGDFVPETTPPVVAAVKATPPKVKPPAPEKKVTPPVVAEVKPKETPREEPKVSTGSSQTRVTPEPVPIVKNEKFKEGSVFRIEKLQFESNSSSIKSESFPQLDEIYQLLNTNSNLVIEIGGHTNLLISDSQGLQLSTSRARAVADYLINKGIEKTRLVVKGYGKARPIEKGNSQAANRINQRVEIKILSNNG